MARTVTTRHELLTGDWTADVETFEKAIRQFTVDRPLTNDCRVVFFEVPGDGQLHVNVTHKRETMAARGWVGPARMSDGFLHNRRFDETPPRQILRHIRDMVFAGVQDRTGGGGSDRLA